MLDRLYYKLTEAESILSTSRDGVRRLERAGLLVMHGENHIGYWSRIAGAARPLRAGQGQQGWDQADKEIKNAEKEIENAAAAPAHA